jgi:hypothetical protein
VVKNLKSCQHKIKRNNLLKNKNAFYSLKSEENLNIKSLNEKKTNFFVNEAVIKSSND